MKKIFLLLALAFSTQAKAELLSAYTSLVDQSCVVYDSADLHKDPEIDFLTQECSGLGGYQVMITGGDLRYPLSLVYNGTEITLTRIYSFHQVASSKIEWLYERSTDGRVQYKALIHRIGYDAGTNSAKDTEILIVTKLDKEKTCPVAVISPSKNMNAQARAKAEQVDSLKCLDPDTTSF